MTDNEAYLVHSYLYYVLDSPVVTDSEFDSLCNRMLNNFDASVPGYKYGELIERDALKSGTGYHLMFKIPDEIKEIAHKIVGE